MYKNFKQICTEGTYDDIREYVKRYDIDVNHNNGYYLKLVAERDDVSLLNTMVLLGGDIHLNNELICSHNIINQTNHSFDMLIQKHIDEGIEAEKQKIIRHSRYKKNDNNIRKKISSFIIICYKRKVTLLQNVMRDLMSWLKARWY